VLGLQAFGFRNVSRMSREATHLEIVTLPPDPVYSNSTVAATVRVLNGISSAQLQSTRSVSVRELRTRRIPGDTSSSEPQSTSALARTSSAEVDKKFGVATIDYQMSTPCVEAQLVFEAGFLRSAISRTVLVRPGNTTYFDKAPPPNARVEIVSLQPLSGKSIIAGQPVVVKLQLVDCTGARLSDLDLKHATALVSSPMSNVLFRHERVTITGSDHVLTIPDLVIDTPGKLKLNFALAHAAFPEIANASVDLEVYQGQWWRDRAWNTLTDLGGSSAVLVDDRVLIFGGIGSLGAVNRLAEFVPRLNDVSTVLPSSALLPTARFKHAACAQKGAMWVYGGFSLPGASVPLGGLYRYLREARIWEDWSDIEKQPSGLLAPKLLANASALILFDARSRSNSIVLHILSTVSHRHSTWENVSAPEDLLSFKPLDAIIAMHPQGSSILILSNTTLIAYALASDVWSHVRISASPESSASGNIFSECLWLGDRLLFLGVSTTNVLQVSTLQVNVASNMNIEVLNSTHSRHAQRKGTILDASWLQAVDVTLAPVVRSDTALTFLSMSASQMLVIGGPVSDPWRVSDVHVTRLSLEAAFALRLVLTTLPGSSSAGALLQPQVQVVDEAGRLVIGGQQGRRIEVSGVTNGTAGLAGSLHASVVRGIAQFTSLTLTQLSSGMMLSFSESFGVFEDIVSANAIEVLPGDPARLEIVQSPRGLYIGTPFLVPLRLQLRDRFQNVVDIDFWTRVVLEMEVWSSTNQTWVVSSLLSGHLNRISSAGQVEFEDIAIKADPHKPFRLTVRSLGLPVTIVDDLSISNYTDSELLITGLQQAIYTSGRIGDVRVMRVARISPGARIQPLTGDNTSTVSVKLLPAHLLGPVVNQSEGQEEVRVFGSRTIHLIQGSAVFTDLSVFRAGSGYVLDFSDSEKSHAASCILSSDASCVTFDIRPGAPTMLSLHSKVIAGDGGSAFPEQPVVSLSDSAGNLVVDEQQSRVVAASATLARVSESCPDGWTNLESTCFRFHTTALDWATARQRCVDLGGDLAYPVNQAQQDFLWSMAGVAAWIGVDDRMSEGSWRTPGGQVISYSNWCTGEPSQYGGGGYELCAHLGLQSSGCWNDSPCGFNRPYLCQMNSAIGQLSTSPGSSSHVVGATLHGRTMIATKGGHALFTDLALDLAASFRLMFSAQYLANANLALTVAAGAPASLFLVKQPGNGTSARALADQPVVGFMDKGGNVANEHSGTFFTVYAWLERTWPPVGLVFNAVSWSLVTPNGTEASWAAAFIGASSHIAVSRLVQWSMQARVTGLTDRALAQFVAVICQQSSRPPKASVLVNSSIFHVHAGQLGRVATLSSHGLIDLAHFKAKDSKGIEGDYLAVASASFRAQLLDNAPADFAKGYQGQIPETSGDYITRVCTSTTAAGPVCEVKFSELPLASTGFSLTIAVINTDFGSEDEVVSAVYIGGRKVGGPFLSSGGKDSACSEKTVIVHALDLAPDSFSAQGEVLVRIETSSSVGSIKCNGLTLLAETTIAWSTTAIYRIQSQPAPESTLHVQSPLQLVHVQSLQGFAPRRLTAFEIGNVAFLAVAVEGVQSAPAQSPLFKWNSAKNMLERCSSIETHRATSVQHFKIGSQDFIAMTNSFNFTTASSNSSNALYEWDGVGFQHRWDLFSPGDSELFFFHMSSTPYFLIAPTNERSDEMGSSTQGDVRLMGYDSTRKAFVHVQSLPLSSVSRITSLTRGGLTWIVAATHATANQPSSLHVLIEACGESVLNAGNVSACEPAMQLALGQVRKCCDEYLDARYGASRAVESHRNLRLVQSIAQESQAGLASLLQFGADPHYVVTASNSGKVTVHTLFAKDEMQGTLYMRSNQTQIPFTDLAVPKMGEFVLQFTSNLLLLGTASDPFEIVSGPAYKLYVARSVGGAFGGSPFNVQPVIHVHDHGDNFVSSHNFSVSASLLQTSHISFEEFYAVHRADVREGRGCGDRWCSSMCAEECAVQNNTVCMHRCFLQYPSRTEPLLLIDSEQQKTGQSNLTAGFITAHGIGGVAEFTHLGVKRAGLNYSLEITSPGLLSVTTERFSVAPGAPYSFEIARHPSGAIAGKPFSVQPHLQLFDRGENHVEAAHRAVASVQLLNNPRGVMSLSGTTVLAFAGPFVSFTDLAIGLLSRDYTLAFQVWVLDGNATYNPALPDVRERVPGASVSNSFQVFGGEAEALSARSALLAEGSVAAEWVAAAINEIGVEVEGARARLTLLQSGLFAHALEGMDLRIFNNLNRTVLTMPILLHPGAYARGAAAQDVSVNISSDSDLNCLSEWWNMSAFASQTYHRTNLTYRIYSHAGRDALILSGFSVHDTAHGTYRVENYDDRGLPIYEQQLAESIFLGGPGTCQEDACEASSFVLSTVSGVYIKMEIEHGGFPVYRRGSHILYRAAFSVEPSWRLATLDHASNPFVISIFSTSVSQWGGSYRLFFQNFSKEWVVHRVPPGVEAGFANDILEHEVNAGADASASSGPLEPGCYLCEMKTGLRKHQGRFWFAVEKGSFAEVGAKCAAHGGDMASIHSLADALVARLVCPTDDCYIGLGTDLASSPASFWWSDGSLANYNIPTNEAWNNHSQIQTARWVLSGANGTTWKWAGNGTKRFAGVCTVKGMSDCAQCGAVVLRASSREEQLPDHVRLWQERNGSKFVINSRMHMYRAPVAEVQDAGGNLVHADLAVSEATISLLSQDPVPEPGAALGMGALALTSFSLGDEERLVLVPIPAQRLCNQTSCSPDFDSASVLYSWRWPRAGHTTAHMANGNFFFKNQSPDVRAKPGQCPMDWECNGSLSYLPVFPDPSQLSFETFYALFLANNTRACEDACSSVFDLCVETFFECMIYNDTACLQKCFMENRDATLDSFPTVGSAESLLTWKAFGADAPEHSGVECSVGGSLAQKVLRGALPGDTITWEITAGQLVHETPASFEIRLDGERVLGPVTPLLATRFLKYQWQYVVPSAYDSAHSRGMELSIRVISDSPFPQEPPPSIVFGALRVVNHVSDVAFESLEVLEQRNNHESLSQAVTNKQLLGTYAKTDVSYNGHPVYCRRFSSDGADKSTGSNYTEAESEKGDGSKDGDGASGSASGSSSASASASTSASFEDVRTSDAASPVAHVETAYLVYSQGLWLVTTGISPRSLASSPLLLTWGTSDFIASHWRELTPYEPSSKGDTARKNHSGVPLEILLHVIAHLRPDQYPAATAAGEDSNNQSLAWALSTVSSLAVHETSPVLEQHSMLSHAGTLPCTCADAPNVLRS
jgi:hypothetical protein